MRKFTRMLQVLLLVAITQNVFGQLSGTYSIGASGIVAGETGNYATFAAAITALNSSGVNGPCTFYFSESKTYTEAADVALGCTGTSSTNTITFKPYTGVSCILNFANTGASITIDGHFVIGAANAAGALPGILIPTSYVIIDGSNSVGGTSKDLTIQDVAAAVQRSIFRIYGNNDNITIKNCIINCNSTSASTIAPINVTNYFNASNFTPDNLTIQNNTLTSTGGNGGIGITLSNSGSTTVGNTGIVFQKNIISAKGTRPISFNNVADGTIADNTISMDNQLGAGGGAGIYLANTLTAAAGTFNVYNNTFTKIATLNNTAGASNGIIAIDNELGTLKIVNIYNNVIRGFQTTAAVSNSKIYGIRHIGASTSNVYNNSIYLPDLTNMTTFGSSLIAGIAFATAATTEAAPSGTMIAKNNIIFMDESSMKVWAIRRVGTGGSFTSDNNDFFVNTGNAAGNVGFYNATDYKTLNQWSTISSQDVSSISSNPNYTSATDLTPTTGNDLIGTNLGTVTTDILNNARLNPPTMGAYELSAASTPGIWSQTAANQLWSDPGNWRDGNVPSAGNSIYIPPTASNMPMLAASASIGRLLNNGVLTISGSNTLSVAGNLFNNGQITATNSTLILNGTTAQTVTLGGTSGFINVQDFTLSNAQGATINRTLGIGKVNVTGTVSFGNVNGATLATGGYLFLKSNLIATGRIADLTNAGANTGNAITGNVTLERVIPGGLRAFRFLSHPFNASLNLSVLTSQIDITGNTAGLSSNPGLGNECAGCTQSGSNAPSSYSYNTAASTGAGADGWQAYTSVTAGTWAQNQGIRVLIRGGFKGTGLDGTTPTPADVVIATSGALTDNGGSAIINLVNAGSNYNFVGNPFASQVDLNLTSRSNVGTNFWTWDPYAGGGSTKGAYVNTPFASSYILPSSSAFFVQATGAAPSITFPQTSKVSSSAAALFRTSQSAFGKNSIQLKLTTNAINWDRLLIFLDAKSNASRDENDGDKMYNPAVSFYTLSSDNKALSIDSRKINTNEIIPLGIINSANNNYTITAADFDVEAGTEVWLNDKFLGTSTKLGYGTTYNFSTTTNAASQGNGRFELAFKSLPQLTLLATTFSVKLSPNPTADVVKVSFTNATKANTTITILNVDGKIVKTVEAGNVQSGQIDINVKGFAKGNYFVTLSNGTEKQTEKLIVQ